MFNRNRLAVSVFSLPLLAVSNAYKNADVASRQQRFFHKY